MNLPAEDRAPRIAREAAVLAVVGVLQFAGTTGAAQARWHADAAPLWPWGYLLIAAIVAALPLRHRSATGGLALVFTLTLAYWSSPFPRGPVFLALIVAFGTVVIQGRRRTAIGTAVLGFLLFPWLGYLLGFHDPPEWESLVALLAWLTTLISVTEALRFRRERARERERSREEAVRRQAGEERLRVAREVHDAVAHAMSLITIQAGVALHRGADLPPETREALGVIRSTSREALVELRGILGVLRDMDGQAPRAPTPGLSRLDDLRSYAAKAGLDLRLTVRGLPPDGLPGTVDVAAYRIIQEALTNAVRHAGRCRVTADVQVEDGELVIEVLDDGRARPGGQTVPGNGIIGMQERAAAVGGSLVAGQRASGGFAVRAWLPLPAAATPAEAAGEQADAAKTVDGGWPDEGDAAGGGGPDQGEAVDRSAPEALEGRDAPEGRAGRAGRGAREAAGSRPGHEEREPAT